MKNMWYILPIAAALSACGGGGGDKDPKTKPPVEAKTYQFQLSGEVIAGNGVEHQLDIYAGNTKLGQGKTNKFGSYSIALSIDEATYNKVKDEQLRLAAELTQLQLVKLSSSQVAEAVENTTLTANISTFSTANYILADLNNDGAVSRQEWLAYQGSQHVELINQNLLKYATAVKSAITDSSIAGTSGSLSWLSELKAPEKWNQWFNQHQQALALAWQATLNDPVMATEAQAYLKGGAKQLSDYNEAEVLKASSDKAQCQLAIKADDNIFDPNKSEVGQKWQFTAQISDSLTGSRINDEPKWKSSNTKVVSVSNSGLVSLLAEGKAELGADYSHNSSICSAAPLAITVEKKQPEPVTLSSITIGALPATIKVNETVSLQVSSSWSDQSTRDISGLVNWSANPTTAVRFEGDSLVALQAGKVSVSATYQGKADIRTIVIELVDPLLPELTAIRISGYGKAKEVGESWQLKAFGLYSDKSESDISAKVKWRSDNTAVASIDASGLVTAKAEGKAVITAIYGGVSHQQAITVKAVIPVATHLTMAGDVGDLNKGETVSLSVYAYYADKPKSNVTEQVIWASSNDAIATVANGNLRALSAGEASITATLPQANGKELSVKQNITVIPATVVAVMPDILSGTFTMKEGETYDFGIKIKFSDGEIKDYSDQLKFLPSGQDESGLMVINDYFDKTIRALRAGTATLNILGISDELRHYLNAAGYMDKGISFGLGTATLEITVDENPDVYQWHKSMSPELAGEDVTNVQNIIYNNVIYRFWQENLDSFYRYGDVYVTTFDGTTHSKPQKILEGHSLISNQMVDGGGNGYALLLSVANGDIDHFIYNLHDGSTQKIDISGVPFTKINPNRGAQSFGFSSDGNLIVLDHGTYNRNTAYIYRKKSDNPAVWEWVTGDTVEGNYLQLPSYPDHMIVLENSIFSTPKPLPKIHFINRKTGKVDKDKVAQLTYPISASESGSYCKNITLVPGSSIERFGAFCSVKTSNGVSGYWLWEDNNLPPKIYKKLDGDTLYSSKPHIAVRDKEGRIVATAGTIRDEIGESMLQINSTVADSDAVLARWLDKPSRYNADLRYSTKLPLYESASLLIENPYVPGEKVLMTHDGIAIQPANSHDWVNSDQDMYALPKEIGTSSHLFKLNNTWFILSNKRDKEIWKLQLRKPDPVVAH